MGPVRVYITFVTLQNLATVNTCNLTTVYFIELRCSVADCSTVPNLQGMLDMQGTDNWERHLFAYYELLVREICSVPMDTINSRYPFFFSLISRFWFGLINIFPWRDLKYLFENYKSQMSLLTSMFPLILKYTPLLTTLKFLYVFGIDFRSCVKVFQWTWYRHLISLLGQITDLCHESLYSALFSLK